MANREPKTVEDILERIEELKAGIAKYQERIKELQGRLSLRDEKPEPNGFDYGSAVLSVFRLRPDVELKVDDVEGLIEREFGFTPNREKIVNKISYLVYRDKKLIRIEGRRGMYKLNPDKSDLSPFDMNRHYLGRQ